MPLATLNIRIDPELKNAFMEAAKSMDRNGSQLIRDFMRQTVERQTAETKYNDWFTAQVQEGIEQSDRGELLSSESVDASAAAWRGDARRKLDNK